MMTRRKGEDDSAAKAVSRARRDLVAGALLVVALAVLASSGWQYVASLERMLNRTSHAADLATGDRMLMAGMLLNLALILFGWRSSRTGPWPSAPRASRHLPA